MIRPDFREMKDELYHYGTKGKSGRYPLGSGERPYQDYPGMRRNSKKSLGSTIKDKMYKRQRKVYNAILDEKRRDLNKLESRYEKSKDKKGTNKKLGIRAVGRLNSSNNYREAYASRNRFINRMQKERPEYTDRYKDLLEKEKVLNSDYVKHYSRKFNDQLKEFEDAGIKLNAKRIRKSVAIGMHEYMNFTGTRYYKKAKDKKLDDKNKKRGKITYNNHIQQMNQINMMNQQLQQQMQEQRQIMQQQQTINMMSHPFMF